MGGAYVLGGAAADTIYGLIQLWALGAARFFGASLVFTAFVWGHLNSGIIRVAFAMAMALPVLAPVLGDPLAASLDVGPSYWILLPKEFVIGLLLGLATSLPLEAVGTAGNVIDGVRGGGQLPGPAGDNTVFGHLFMVAGLWVFAALGGFWLFVDMIYASYGLWPMTGPVPTIDASVLPAVARLLVRFAEIVVVLAGPPVVLLLAIDVAMLVAGRVGRRMNVLDLNQSIKSLALLLVMPLFMIVVVRVIAGRVPVLFDLRDLVSLLQP